MNMIKDIAKLDYQKMIQTKIDSNEWVDTKNTNWRENK